MQRRSPSLPFAEKPGAPEFGLGGLPERLPWPLAGLAILGMAALAWVAIIGVALRVFGAR
jgi:hypothetical protein